MVGKPARQKEELSLPFIICCFDICYFVFAVVFAPELPSNNLSVAIEGCLGT